jgi:hypothetical protein
MIRTVTVSLAILLLAGATRAEGEAAKSGGGGDGYSQQYHYSSYPQHGGGHGGYAGLSIDLGTGVFLAVGAIIVLLALTAVLHPLSKGHGDSGWGAGGAASGTYRSLNAANLSEKVLSGIERIYETYNKMQ